jgi:hypothetical protein
MFRDASGVFHPGLAGRRAVGHTPFARRAHPYPTCGAMKILQHFHRTQEELETAQANAGPELQTTFTSSRRPSLTPTPRCQSCCPAPTAVLPTLCFLLLLLKAFYRLINAFIALKEGGVSCAAVLLVRLPPPVPGLTRVGGGGRGGDII